MDKKREPWREDPPLCGIESFTLRGSAFIQVNPEGISVS